MATSGSWDYSRSATQIVSAAMENLGVVIPGGTVPTAHLAAALVRLNHLVKQWQGDADGFPGLHIVHRQRVNLFFAEGQQTYLIGPASTDARSTTRYGRTTIDAAEASGQTVISVTATSDTTTEPGTTITATAADIIGIEQDDGTIHWSTVASISAGDTITIDDATSAAAAVGNYVWWFTSRAQRFVLCESAVLRDENYNDTPIKVYTSVEEYEQGVADKYADGDPTAILIEPLRITTRITLNSQPTDVTKTLRLTVQYPAEDYDDAANDIAFPQEYLAALEWELAFRCASFCRVQWTQTMKDNHANAISVARRLNPEMSTLFYRRDDD